MKKNIIIIAAPFGYGPASIALLIAEALADLAKVTILSDRDAYRFVAKYKRDGMQCREGIFSSVFSRREDIAQFDTIISVSNELAVHYLIGKGFASRAVFVDCLLPWRSEKSSVRFASNILAYLVQDYPDAARYLGKCKAEMVKLTAPMVWAPEEAGRHGDKGKSVVLQLGGITSPLIAWEKVSESVRELIAAVTKLTGQSGKNLTIIGSRHLGQTQTGGGAVAIMADVSPREAAALINQAELVLTTPGIGTIYEAMTCKTPALLLPPMNSTQLSQYRVFTGRGFPGTIKEEEFAEIFAQAVNLSWDRQTHHAVDWLNRNCGRAVAEIGVMFKNLFAEENGRQRLEDLVRNQDDFRAGLSRTNVVEIIRELLVGPSGYPLR